MSRLKKLKKKTIKLKFESAIRFKKIPTKKNTSKKTFNNI